MYLCCVAKPGKPIQTIILVTSSSVQISHQPPADVDDSKAVKYLLKYRKYGRTRWISTTDTSEEEQTVTGLEADSIYAFMVSAKYVGGRWGPPSELVRIKTKSNVTGK